jgi:DNA invertase Pin-like site-specific DNA recombinase
MIVGYARVSTDGQALDAQQIALREAGADRVFAEKETGIKTDRAALAKAVASLGPGDTAQARGVRFGRKLKLTPHQRREALARREAGESLAEIGRSYNVSHSTISRLHEVTSF